jgi:arsenate reductase
MKITIYHNPRCSKSRQTLELLQTEGIAPDIVEYLQNPPSAETILSIASQLNLTPRELMRTGEDDFKADREKLETMDDTAISKWLSTHPKVIQRPIVITDKGARIGRPPENVLEIV